jgi:hypothetical protein
MYLAHAKALTWNGYRLNMLSGLGNYLAVSSYVVLSPTKVKGHLL